MDDRTRTMLEAHVRFELDRWSDDGLRAAIADEVADVLAELGDVAVGELVDLVQLREVLARAVTQVPLTEALGELIVDVVGAVHQHLLTHPSLLAHLVEPSRYDQVVEVLVGMRELRAEIIDQITTSSVYSQLMAHVLYHGIKNYLVTQNLLTRKIPGASSMLRFGQSAMNAAAPSLERAVDRQLAAFIAGNVAETVRGSSDFLLQVMDDDMIRAVGAEVWATNSPRSVSELVALLSQPSAAESVHAARELWEGLRSAAVVSEVVTAAVDGFLDVHGQRSLADLLDELGLTGDVLADQLGEVLAPVVRGLRERGVLERRIRTRLAAFYSTWTGG